MPHGPRSLSWQESNHLRVALPYHCRSSFQFEPHYQFLKFNRTW